MARKTEIQHRLQRRRKEKKYVVTKIVWLNLDMIHIEQTPFASAAAMHKRFMHYLGKVQWCAFHFPINGRMNELKKAITEADHFVIHSKNSIHKLDNAKIAAIVDMIEMVKKYNEYLKIYTNNSAGKKINPGAIEFTNPKHLLTILKQTIKQ
jgi:hypothetical protein